MKGWLLIETLLVLLLANAIVWFVVAQGPTGSGTRAKGRSRVCALRH
jgi:hypothetical protein